MICLLTLASLTHAFAQPFTPTGSLANGRLWHTATVLNNGKVLVTGGFGVYSGPVSKAEVYDPSKGTFTSTGALQTPRYQHTATLLSDGKVLIVGGRQTNTTSSPALVSAEVYDPSTGTFTPTGSLSAPRFRHTATLLPDGKVLIVGGASSTYGSALSSAELYDLMLS